MKKYILLAFMFFAVQQTQGMEEEADVSGESNNSNICQLACKMAFEIKDYKKNIMKNPYYDSHDDMFFKLIDDLPTIYCALQMIGMNEYGQKIFYKSLADKVKINAQNIIKSKYYGDYCDVIDRDFYQLKEYLFQIPEYFDPIYKLFNCLSK